jgi:hypothetical protein
MYNLTVAIAHTFFVGEEQWLVHNANHCGNDKIVKLGRGYTQYMIWRFQGFVDEIKWAGEDITSPSGFAEYLNDALKAAKEIHFDVAGMDFSTLKKAFQDDRIVNSPKDIPFGPDPKDTGFTNYELYRILTVRDYFAKTKFTKNGVPLSVEENIKFYKEMMDSGWMLP